MKTTPHLSVLLPEIVALLAMSPGDILLDGTLGFAGHSEALLSSVDGQAHLIGLDRDPDALAFSKDRLAAFPTVTLSHSTYADFPKVLAKLGITQVQKVLLDLGISSWQIDQGHRGFSFQHDGPLDMRMDQTTGQTAADLLRTASEAELLKIFQTYGELYNAQKLARMIYETRRERPILTINDLTYLIKKSFYFKNQRSLMMKTFAQVFQALRIVINNELGQLETFLETIPDWVAPGGRIAIISFHSLEDRLVKQFYKAHKDQFTRVGKAVISPTYAQAKDNPRARSAKLRVLEKI